MRNVLYVSNLPARADEALLRDRFAECGEVSSVRFVADTGITPRRFALVTMASASAAERAVSRFHGALLDERFLSVSVLEGKVLPQTKPPPRHPEPQRAAAAFAPSPPLARQRARVEDDTGRRQRSTDTAPKAPGTRVTQQFRERRNMTYELDCSGTALVVRVFFPSEAAGAPWRIEASAAGVTGNDTAIAEAASRKQALQHIAEHWQNAEHSRAKLDWPAVAQAMAAVRAI